LMRNVGIRREDMYAWERRAPLIPQDAEDLVRDAGIPIVVQRSPKRAFADGEYTAAGLPVEDSLEGCSVILGLKEIPIDVLERDKTYVFFSHTIKGQPANMPMLQRALDLGCTVIDYERIVDEHNRRLIFFGNYAGLAGMIDSLWALGNRLASEGIDNPLSAIRQASTYESLREAKEAIQGVGEAIRRNGLPKEVSPLVVGVAGYGNVSRGAQEILDLLPVSEISPADLLSNGWMERTEQPIVKVVFKEEDTVVRLDPSGAFDLSEYYEHPERYRGVFAQYLPHLHLLVNCIYWEPKYPRLVQRDDLSTLYADEQPTLRVIGDITCDVEGSIESTVKATEPDDPVYVFEAATGQIRSGVEGNGPVMMAVEILPTELPRESSTYFSGILKGFVPALAAADYTVELELLDLPAPLKRAIIAYRGELTPAYQYIGRFLPSSTE